MPPTASNQFEATPPTQQAFDYALGLSEGRRPSPVTDERIVDVCDCVMDIIAALFNVSGRELRQSGRSPADVARARQIGMYVTHVILGLSMNEVGRGFGRDRTTVLHACHLIEDMRDDEEFDEVIHLAERVTAAAFRSSWVLECGGAR